MMDVRVDKVVDTRHEPNAVPMRKLKEVMEEMSVGEVMELISTDKHSKDNVRDWVMRANQELVSIAEHDDEFHYFVKKVKD